MAMSNKLKAFLISAGTLILAFVCALLHVKNRGRKEENRLYENVKKSSDDVKRTLDETKDSIGRIGDSSQSTLDILEKYK